MKKLLYILAAILLSSYTLSAQTKYQLSGYVVDSLSAEPVAGVTITLGANRGTYSNEYGFFSLIVSEKVTSLTIESVAHKTKTVKIDATNGKDLKIALSPSNIAISDVLVEAKGSVKTVIPKNLGSYSINSQQLYYTPALLGERDIFKLFQLLPGVHPGKEGSSGLNLRGGSSDQTLIMLDDIPIYNSAHAFGFISIFSGDCIKSAELHKGYIPSQYGGRLSGVANMSIKEGNRNEHKFSYQFGTTTIAALAEGPIDSGRGSYLLSGRYFIPDLLLRGYASIGSKKNATYTYLGFYDMTAKFNYDISKRSKVYASFYTGNDALKMLSYNTNDFIDSSAPTTTSKAGFGWGNIVGSLRFTSQLSEKSFLNVTAYYSHLNNEMYDDVDGADDEDLSSITRSYMSEFGLKSNIKQSINSWYNLNYGFNMSYQSFVPHNVQLKRNDKVSETKYGSRELYTANIYADNQFRFGDFALNIGGRVSIYNNNSDSRVIFEPRTSLSYYMDNSSLWVSYTKNSQPLFSANSMLLTLPVDYWIPFQNSSELPISSQVALGYKRVVNDAFEFQAEAYYKESENISIIYNLSDFLLDEGGYELSTGTAYGFELLAQYTKNDFNAMLSYTYSKSLQHTNGVTHDFIYDTPNMVNLFMSYKTVKREGKSHTLSVNTNFKSGMPFMLTNLTYPSASLNGTDYISSLDSYPLYPNSRLQNFFRVDINYSMEKKKRKGSRIWQLSLLNATATRNPYIVFADSDSTYDYITGEVTNKTSLKSFVLIPILPSISYIRRF